MVKRGASRRLIGLLALGLLPATALAHPETSPLLVNRYLTVVLVGERLDLFLTFLYGDLPAIEERRLWDQNNDRRLSPAELDRAGESWRRRLPALVSATLDGAPLRLQGGQAVLQVGNDDGVGAAPLAVEVTATAHISHRAPTLRIAFGEPPPRLGETEVLLDLSPAWELVKGGSGLSPQGTESRVKLGEQTSPEGRTVTYGLRFRGAPETQVRRRFLWVMLAAALLLGGGFALRAGRRLREVRR